MPDLTEHDYWMCAEWHEWCTSSAERLLGGNGPKCNWNQYIDGGEPKDGKCPLCGGDLKSVRWAE